MLKGGGGYSRTLAIWVCAAIQGMVFKPNVVKNRVWKTRILGQE